MNLVVFLGPSLDLSEARRQLDATFLPPVAQGDVYRAARGKPDAIGIVDGYFDRIPAVWHKEILWALANEIPVFGAASMGALRAAELAIFGMIGVGKIFKLFHEGDLEDDDEVAVSHLPKEYGFRPTTEAMVNIRATLAAAEQVGVIGSLTRDALVRVGKSLHFSERKYPAILDGSRRMGVSESEVEALRRWLPDGRVDTKRADALSMLKVMPWLLAQGCRPDPGEFFFEDTNAWQEAREQIDAEK